MNVDNLNVSHASGTVYDGFSARFEDSMITLVLGASGCGKTTLLHAIAERAGRESPVSFVFQEPRLIPWASVRANMNMALAANGYSPRELRSRVDEYLDLVGILGRADDHPGKLSGGERQRVAIARAFANPAPVLLMDEPFQSQDPTTKRQLIALFKEIQSAEKRTVIAVTHNLEEAEYFGDWLMLLSGKPARIALNVPNDEEGRKTLSSRF